MTVVCLRHLNAKTKKRPVLLAFFSCLLLVLFTASCSKYRDKKDHLLTFSGNTMGTTYSIKVLADPDTHQKLQPALAQQIEHELQEFNQHMSTWIADSELSLVNKAPEGEWIALSASLFELLEISQQVSRQSDGAFDITVMPLVNLWGFGPEETNGIPSDEALRATLAMVGYQYIELNERKLKKNRPLTIDLSAVAKGFGVDLIADMLEKHKLTHYMVEIGGEIRMRGLNPKQKPWVIGIEKPALGREGALQAVAQKNFPVAKSSIGEFSVNKEPPAGIAIATSGDYRNYHEYEGKRLSHTINPRTGHPIKHTLASVTVVHKNCALADAWATALNVLGPVDGYNLAVKRDLAAFFIIRQNDGFRIEYTDQFKNFMVDL